MSLTNGTNGTDPKAPIKIALLGSAPSSVALAPFNDPTWRIWVCSPGAVMHIRRADAWFELHRWEPPGCPTGDKPWFSRDYIAFMAGLKCPVYMIHPVPEIPCSEAYPLDAALDYEYLPRTEFTDSEGNKRILQFKFSDYFWTSSLSYMFALAIMSGADEIALYGIDMSAQEEWFFQRSGCHYFLDIAKQIGIKVTLPPESDLLRPPPLYGFCEVDPMHIKLLARKNELRTRKAQAEQRAQMSHNEMVHLDGALDGLEYDMKTWITHPKIAARIYAQPELELAKQDERAKAHLTKEIAHATNGHAPELISPEYGVVDIGAELQ